VNDWIRLYDAQLQIKGGESYKSEFSIFLADRVSAVKIAGTDVVLHDMSDVNRLVPQTVDIIDELGSMGLNPCDVLQTFRAITESTLSPRGAILLDALVYSQSGRSVPFHALKIMSENDLIEIRNGNPDVLDYPELEPFAQEGYVCATRPLARASMIKVMTAIEKATGKAAENKSAVETLCLH
jgi:hypothetical protein